tara:strand:- start:430 stop:885 length:456 start_codon:yes stop_codon:yes gene_type:complete
MRKKFENIPPETIMYGSLITDVCERLFNLPEGILREPNRTHDLVSLRAACYFLLHTTNNLKITNISSFFNRDHASVIHGLNNHHRLYLDNHRKYRKRFKEIETSYQIKLSEKDDIDDDSLIKQVLRIDKTIEELNKTKNFLMKQCVTQKVY